MSQNAENKLAELTIGNTLAARVAVMLLMAITFLVDTQVPLGYAVWAVYPACVLISALWGSKRAVVLTTTAACVLIVVGALFSPPGYDAVGMVNRPLGILQTLGTGGLCLLLIAMMRSLREENSQRRETDLKLRERNAVLETQTHDLRQELERLRSYIKLLEEEVATTKWMGETGKLMEGLRKILEIAGDEIQSD